MIHQILTEPDSHCMPPGYGAWCGCLVRGVATRVVLANDPLGIRSSSYAVYAIALFHLKS